MQGQGNVLMRMVICALLAVGAWNLGIIVSRTFIFHQPYSLELMNIIIPMFIGAIAGFIAKPKAK